MECKMATPETMLCKGLPQEFLDMMIYVRGLEYEEKPNYEMMRGKFKNVLGRLHPNKKEELLTDWQLVRKLKREEKKNMVVKSEEKAKERDSPEHAGQENDEGRKMIDQKKLTPKDLLIA